MQSIGKKASFAVAATLPGVIWVSAASAVTTTGTTVGGSTWNRPVANGTTAPTVLSDTATSTTYTSYSYTPTVSGLYDFASVVASPATSSTVATWDNYLVLYNGTFSASSPLTNAVRANDDDNGTAGSSALLGVTLTAGTTYTLVTTGNTNGDYGTYTNNIQQTSILTSGTTANGSTGDLFGDGGSERYVSNAFTVSASGFYNFLSTASYDNYLAVISGSSDPTSSSATVLASNDDSDSATRAGFANLTLTAGTTYYLVTAGSSSSAYGTYVDYVSGVGTASLVPEPSVLSLGLTAGVLAFRRRRT